MIPFGPLAPDAGASAPGTCLVADGVLPIPGGYGPAAQLVTLGANALPADPRGSLTCIKRDGTVLVLFFTATKVYQLETDYTWTELATGYNCTSGDDWSAVQFGNFALFTNTTDGLWALDIEAGGSPTYIADAGDPREIEVINNVVFAFDCKDDAGDRDNRMIRNCAVGDHTNWETREADSDSMETGGELICGRGLSENTMAILQRQGVKFLRLGAIGSGLFYSLTDISNETGAVGSKSCVKGDGVVFGLSSRGFFQLSGAGLKWIGDGYLDDWFLDRVSLADLPKVQGAIDPAHKRVVWRYPMSADASSTATEHVVSYSWEVTDRPWSTETVTLSYLSRIATPGYTLTSWAAAFTDLAGSPNIPIGDRFWQGGKQQILAALDSSLKFATFSGTPQAATLTTSTINSPVTTVIKWATGIDDAPGYLELGVADSLADTITWKDPASKVSAGRFPLRGRGNNIAFRRTIPSGSTWTYANGVDHIVGSGGGPK